jgi:hypothetical protein
MSGRLLIVVLICGAVFFVLLTGPVVGDVLLEWASREGAKIGPKVLAVGLSTLIIGLAIGLPILELVGGCVLGALVLGFILDNY